MIECLSGIGVGGKDLRIIAKMYWEKTGIVRIEGGVTSEFKIKKGVRQGCVLSSSLFNLYTEQIFREGGVMKGVTVGGANINNLRYGDDIALLACNEKDLQDLVTAVNDKGKPYGMEMNVMKTKTMVISRSKQAPKINISVEGEPIEQVEKMVYLGHIVTETGKSDTEIKRRIAKARSSFTSLYKVLTSREVSLDTRIRLLKCYIWSTLLYGCETWTLSITLEKRIEEFEMWTFRRILKIAWANHKTNDEVLNMAKCKGSLLNIIMKRKLQYFGHIIRKSSLQRLLLEGKVDGKRQRGRPRRMWMDDIKGWTNKRSYAECLRDAQYRTAWRAMTADLLRADSTT